MGNPQEVPDEAIRHGAVTRNVRTGKKKQLFLADDRMVKPKEKNGSSFRNSKSHISRYYKINVWKDRGFSIYKQ